MGTLGSRHDGSVADKRVVNTGVRDQVGLELVEVDVERAVEAERRSDGADNLSNQAVKVLVGGTRDAEVAAANIVDGLVVDEECAVRVLNGAVGGKNGVVRLDDGGGNAGSRIDGEFQLHLLAILGSESLLEKGAESRTGTTTKRVENEEALERLAVVYQGPSC